MVRLVYNESEDRHYVSLWAGLGWAGGRRGRVTGQKGSGRGMRKDKGKQVASKQGLSLLILGLCKQRLASSKARAAGWQRAPPASRA